MPINAAKIEYKSFHFELKSVDEDQGIIEGYLSTFNNVDQGKDRVIKGAFKKTLLEAKSRMQHRGKKYLWPVLWMHDPEKPLGGCLDAYEDERGLYTKFQLDISTNKAGFPNNPLATTVFSGYKNGYIDEQSMGYKAIQKDYDQEGIRNLKECQVWEESCVTSLFAMNDQAIATDVKVASGGSFPWLINLRPGRRVKPSKI
jgi:HK97 family phage prohead protease